MVIDSLSRKEFRRFARRDTFHACRIRVPGLGPLLLDLEDRDLFECGSQEQHGALQRRLRADVKDWCRSNLDGPFSLRQIGYAIDQATGREYALFVGSFTSGEDATLFELTWG